jgi:hypothetical protein
MAPTYGRLAVSKNNWDGAGKNAEMQGKTDYCIAVDLPDDQVDFHKGKFLKENRRFCMWILLRRIDA